MKNYNKLLCVGILALIPVFIGAVACKKGDGVSDSTTAAIEALGQGVYAVLSTGKGEIIVKLEYEKTPLTVSNFVALAEGKMDAAKGKPFYDGLTFHRVISRNNGDDQDFMIQGGDPLGNGTGGPGYKFADEFDSSLRHDVPGILSMANSGPATNGSQFFITLVPTPWLDGKHTIFGHVVKGQDVVEKIKQGDKINSIRIVRVGDSANAFKPDQAVFNTLQDAAKAAAEERLASARKNDIAKIEAKYPKASKSPSGIWYTITKQGSGSKPEAGKTVSMKYKLSLLDGQVLDNSDFHGGEFQFQVGVGQVIPGWDEMVSDMKVGEKRIVVIPPELGYGAAGAGGVVPPNAYLEFDMEMLK
ncbi:peptidylprolyl isomerase [Spirochaetia bacterium]|nr:peptidylprolyl isomerase [Spirochaetia bacterium]